MRILRNYVPIVDRYDHVTGESREIWEMDEFEKMKVIGSDWFQYQIGKKLRV
jgi:hypothetical protein